MRARLEAAIRSRRREAALVLGVFALLGGLGSLGLHLNDEAELSSAAYNLYRGSPYVDELPDAYYLTPRYNWEPRVLEYDGHAYITESRALTVLAAPAYVLLLVLSALLGLQGAVVLLVTGAGALAAVLWRWPAWRDMAPRRRRVEQGALAGAFAALLGANLALARPLDAVLWAPPVALQLNTAALVAAGVTCFHAAARRQAGARAAAVATVILLFGTTSAFWGFGQKYHGAEFALLCVVVWLRGRGGVRSHAGAYAAAGAAVWVHAKTGGLILLALLAVDAVSWLRARPPLRSSAPTAGVLALGLALGLAPYCVENSLLFGSPFLPGYGAIEPLQARAVHSSPLTPTGVDEPAGGGAPSAPTAPSAPAGRGGGDGGGAAAGEPGFLERLLLGASDFVETVERQLRHRTVLASPDDVPEALYAAWVSPNTLTTSVHVHFGLLMLSPLLVLAPLGALERPRGRAVDLLVLAHLALVVFVYGLYAAAPGFGSYDSRYLYVTFPGLAYLSARFLAPRLERLDARALPLAGAMAASGLVAVVAVLGAARGDYTTQFHVLRAMGLVILAAVAAGGLGMRLLGRRISARRTGWGALALLAIGLVPALVFIAQFLVHHEPRTAFGPAGPVSHALPTTGLVSLLLDAWLGP